MEQLRSTPYGVQNPIAQTLLVALSYLAAGWLGLRDPVLAGHISLIWLPSGIALAAVLLWGYRVLPGVALGAALVSAAFGAPAGALIGHVVGATGAAFLGGLALNELKLREGFRRGRDAFYFVVVAILSPLLSATSLVLGIAAAGVAPWSEAFWLLRDAWIGHTMGIVIATPLLVAWAEPPVTRSAPGSVREGAALFLTLAAVLFVTWSGRAPVALETLFLYGALPFFVWAAMRFRFRIVATATTLGWIGAVAGSLLGSGPFVRTADPLITAYAYLGIVSLTTYVIAGLVRERRDTESSLTQSEQKFRDLVHSAPDVIIQVDRKGEIRFANRDTFGASRLRTEGAFTGLVREAYREKLQEKIDLVFWNGTPTLMEAQMGVGRNTRWYSLQLGPVRSGEHIDAVMVIGQDVTERKEAEAALRASEARLRTYFEGSPLPIAILDVSGRFLETNPAVLALLDAGNADLKDYDLQAVAHPRDREDVQALLDDLVHGTANRFVGDLRLLRREGAELWVRLQASLIRDPAGAPLFIVAMMEDISAQRRVVEAEHLAATRAMEIGELQEVSEWKTQLLSIASHELKNPLTPMKLQLDLLKRGIYGSLNDKQSGAVDKLSRQSDRLANLVSGILDVARLQTGRLQIDKQYTDVSRIVADVCDEFEDAAGEWGIGLEKRIEGTPEASADGERLKQVIFNLLSNAFKFTPKGGKVTLHATTDDDEIIVKIQDTGPGLTKQQIDQLFEAFTQVHDTTGGDKKGGLGLGLYISKGIIEAHKGKVWAESTGPGQGTVFGFRIPVGNVQAAKQRARDARPNEPLEAKVDRVTRPPEPPQEEDDVAARIDRLIKSLPEAANR